MKNTLIIGIDLSFNSTGISVAKFNDKISKTISFHRLIFDDNSSIKQFIPKSIYNVNQYTYKLPTNISVNDIIIDNDYNSLIQAESTLKCMICIKRLMEIIIKSLPNNSIEFDLIINIEGFLMPQVSGEQQFKSLSGLIMLQGMLRSEIIKLKLSNHFNIDNLKLFITPPKELKKFFTNNGNADKQIMLDSFIDNWNGKKLLPDTTSLKHINDIIDSFALMMNAYGKITSIIKPKERIIKKRKKKKIINNTNDILKNSLPL